MSDPTLFKWRHFEADLILCAMRWQTGPEDRGSSSNGIKLSPYWPDIAKVFQCKYLNL
jgi:hypothetical protein